MARGTMFLGTVYFMVRRLDMVSFNKPNPVELRKSWADILHVGLPAAGTNAIFTAHRIERVLRDLNVAKHHIAASKRHYEAVGSVLLGADDPVAPSD